MSIYGRFFKPEEKMTFRKVLDRVGVFTAVECKAYIESDRQAMRELFKKDIDGKLVLSDEKEKDIDDEYTNLKRL